MMTLRCTRRLLAYFGEKVSQSQACDAADTLLGDWFANLVLYGAAPIALCVNGPTRYAVVIPLHDCQSAHALYMRLAQRASDAVQRVGAGAEIARRVLDEYRGGVHFAPTNNRSVLGTMNDLAKHLEYALDDLLQSGPIRDPAILDDELNRIPHAPLDYSNAAECLRRLCRAKIN
jgi:hypothetical protein